MPTLTLVNSTHPYLRIYNPATGGYAEFQGGKLQIDDGDPNFAVVTAAVAADPNIIAMTSVTTCPECGLDFPGALGRANLARHIAAVHPLTHEAGLEAAFEAERTIRLKDRAGFACDICNPTPFFGNAEELALHMQLIHAAVTLDEAGNAPDDEEPARRPGEVLPVAQAARPRAAKKG